MARFFVSYTGADTQWAEWVAWTLEDEGHEATLQKWDSGLEEISLQKCKEQRQLPNVRSQSYRQTT